MLILPSSSLAVGFPAQDAQKAVRELFPEQDFNLVQCVLGWLQKELEPSDISLWIHKKISQLKYDGIIIYGADINNISGDDHLASIVAEYGDIPIVNMGYPLNGCPSVIFDNRSALIHLVSILVKQKKCQYFALLQGLKGSYDAEQRQIAVKQSIKDHGLTLDPDYIWQGNFQIENAQDQVDAFLKKQIPLPDVIMCMNDQMAIGVILQLKHHGINVPKDVLVTGYDNISTAQYMDLALTTVQNPMYNMGKKAADVLNRKMSGQVVDEIYEVPSEYYLRESTQDQAQDEHKLVVDAKLDLLGSGIRIRKNLSQKKSIIEMLKMCAQDIYNAGILSLIILDQCQNSQAACRRIIIENGQVNLERVNYIDADRLMQPYKSESNWIMCALLSETDNFGLALFNVSTQNRSITELIAVKLSECYQEEQLNISSNTFFKQVEEAESMAFLGRLVTSITRELNKPIRQTQQFLEQITVLDEELKEGLNNGSLTVKQMHHYVEQMQALQQLVIDKNQQSADLIASFKKISIDQNSASLESICLFDFVKKIQFCLSEQLEGILLLNEIDPEMVIESYAGPWSQIFIHLVLNTVQHNTEHDNLQIKIQGTIHEKKIRVIVTDNGSGLPDSVLLNVFEPYIYEQKVGLGLYTVKQLVESKLCGTIQTNQQHCYGLEFIINVPSENA